MKISQLLAVTYGALLAVALPADAQIGSSPTPNLAYPDSPARANPRAPANTRPAPNGGGKLAPRGPLDWERTVALSPDGRLFLTASLDGRVRVWDTVSGRSDVELPADLTAVVFSPDSRLLACRFEPPASGEGKPYWRVLSTTDGKPAGEPFGTGDVRGDLPETVVFAPDGKRLAGFVGSGASLRVEWWNADDGRAMANQPVKELSGGGVLAFSPDGKTLAAAGPGTAVFLLNFMDLKPLKTIPVDQKDLGAAVFSPDGHLLAVGGQEQRTVRAKRDAYPTASLFDTATGRLLADLKLASNSGAQVRQIVFADDGRAVVTATDRTAQAWSPVDGRLQANLVGGGFPLAVSPDGKTLAGSDLPDLLCWDTSTWRLGLRIVHSYAGYGVGTGHLGYVPLAFLPDGGGIVTLRINSAAAWELPGGRPVIERDATQTPAFH